MEQPTRTIDKDTARKRFLSHLLIAIPAFNEEDSLRKLLPSIREVFPGVPVAVINDGSHDATVFVAQASEVIVLNSPHNMGVGGAMQLAYEYALRHHFRAVLRLDSDGQHPPSEAMKLIDCHLDTHADLVVGSRFGETKECVSSGARYLGIHGLAWFMSLICRTKVSDPTSGFWLVSGTLVNYFAHEYPMDYPEPEAISLSRRLGYSYAEVPVLFQPRIAGKSSIGAFDTVYYIVKVGMALLVDRVRSLNKRYMKTHARRHEEGSK